MDPRPVTLVIGILLTTLGTAMLVPAILDLAVGEANWVVFTVSAVITLFVGVGMTMATWGRAQTLNIKQAFILTTLAWVVIAGFGAIPIHLSDAQVRFTDAYFEAMSGITTTGATVIVGLDAMSPGFLLWRGILQWLGGLGIIVMAVSVLPMLQVGGMQLFRVEAFEASEKVLPRAAQLSAWLTVIYVAITSAAAVAYMLAGMNGLDAAVHAMTTVATGGFSNHDASMGHFNSTAVEVVAVTFMILGSLPFLLYVKALQGRTAALWRDDQVRAFLGIAGAFALLSYVSQFQAGGHAADHGIREAVFNVVSIMTGTGYATVDYDNWGPLAMVVFFTVTFVGGCAGSTSCGIKIFRFQVLFLHMKVQLERVSYPHGVFTPRLNGAAIPTSVATSVMVFFLLFFMSFTLLALGLSLVGLDDLTAISGAATAISNVGPGLGEVIGPAGNFSSLPDAAKWLLAFGMLLGRLELVTVLVLFTPTFWRS